MHGDDPVCHITDSAGVYMYQCVTLQTVQGCTCIRVSHYKQCRGVHVSVCHIIDSAGVYMYQCVTLQTVHGCTRIIVLYYRHCRGVHVSLSHYRQCRGVHVSVCHIIDSVEAYMLSLCHNID